MAAHDLNGGPTMVWDPILIYDRVRLMTQRKPSLSRVASPWLELQRIIVHSDDDFGRRKMVATGMTTVDDRTLDSDVWSVSVRARVVKMNRVVVERRASELVKRPYRRVRVRRCRRGGGAAAPCPSRRCLEENASSLTP